jgi:hypothetical protein
VGARGAREARIASVYAVADDAERNRLITETYCELSRALRRVIGPHANWCTFSTWSSRTVGYFIRGDIDPLLEYRLSRLPGWLRRIARWPAVFANRFIAGLRHRAAPRLLGRGNSEIFREIALQFARFVDEFAPDDDRDDRRWRAYRDTIEPTAATETFPAADVDLLRDGFEAYYEAMHERDLHRRAELVLFGNMLIADYEQRRVDPIVRSALSLFPSRLLNDDPDDPARFTVGATNAKKPWALQQKGPIRTQIDAVYGRLVTRWRMAIVLPAGAPLALHTELIRVGVGLPKPDAGTALFPERLHTLRDPRVALTWARYDHAHGDHRAARARSWATLDDRMNCIVNVFRARQERTALYDVDPFTTRELSLLMPEEPAAG